MKTNQEYKDEAYEHARLLIEREYVTDVDLETLAKKIYRQKKGDSKVPPK